MRKLLNPTLVILFLLVTSCGKIVPNGITTNKDFPLNRFLVLSAADKILKIAPSDTWFVVQYPNELEAVNINTGEAIWTLQFSSDLDSEFSIKNDKLVVASHDQIVVLNRYGQQEIVSLDTNKGSIIRLVAVYDDYIYVIRSPDWVLEIYDISKNIKLWETHVGRGKTDVFLDSSSNVLYIITPNVVSAFENETGRVLWQQERNVICSIYERGILYLCEQTDEKGVFKFTAIKADNQEQVWSGVIETNFVEVYNLTIIGDVLVVGTRKGLSGIDKNTGNQIWHSVKNDIIYTAPVEFNNAIYAKGSSRKIYAISPEMGTVLGFIQLEVDTYFQSKYESLAGVYAVKDGIIFNNETMVILFKLK